ncbi:MAG: hypothetical protein R3F40_17470 [Candidatus Competibacteraceae bacterium]
MTAIGTQNVVMDRSDLLEIELATLFRVSQVLSRPCPLWETLDQVLRILHEYGELHRGVVSLVDPDSGALLVSAIHDPAQAADRRAGALPPGEGCWEWCWSAASAWCCRVWPTNRAFSTVCGSTTANYP